MRRSNTTHKKEEESSPWPWVIGGGLLIAIPFVAVGAAALYGLATLTDKAEEQKARETQKEIKDCKLKVDETEDSEFSTVKVDDTEVDKYNSDVPYAFLCPISHEIMHEPVIIETGQTYERVYIESWLTNNKTCPTTGVELKSKTFIPNYSLKSAIEDWKKKNPVQTVETKQ